MKLNLLTNPNTRRFAMAFAVLAHSTGANADSGLEQPLSTARPSFSGASTTLEAGHLQLEAGYQFTGNDDSGNNSETHNLPQLFLRYGIGERAELNLLWAGYRDVNASGGDLEGVSDLSIGASYRLTEAGTPLAVSVLAAVSLPVGDDEFSSDEPDPGVGFAWSWAGDTGPGWFGTVVANSVTADDERATTLGAAIGASFVLSDALGAYVEYFGVHSDSADSAHSINGGFTALVNKDLQFDVYGGGGLNDAADDYFIGAGFAWRY